jgi:hypothetical protein
MRCESTAIDGSAGYVSHSGRLSFFLDVDNTLLDNDALKDYVSAQLKAALGDDGAAQFWNLYEDVRSERDVVDLPLTARRYAERTGNETQAPVVDRILDDVPFKTFVYPHAFDTIRHLKTLGVVGILSDGDEIFQPRKIEGSGLGAAVDGCILVYPHKEDHLGEARMCQPADQTVLIDDKAQILDNVQRLLGDRVTTVHVLQGHYASESPPDGFRASITVTGIGDLRSFDAAQFWLPDVE